MFDWFKKKPGPRKAAVMERVPFNVRELESMIGGEFYLMVIGQAGRDLFEDLTNQRGTKSDIPVGTLLEVVSREPAGLETYFLGNLRSALYEDGTAVGSGIAGAYNDYIFTLDSVSLADERPAILEGRSVLYKGRPVNQDIRRMVLEFGVNPTSKTHGRIVTVPF